MDAPTSGWKHGPGLIEAVWRYRFWIAVAALVCGLAGWGFAQVQSPVYEAETRLVLGDPRATGVFVDAGRTFVDTERRLVKETERITSREVLQDAAERIEGAGTVPDLGEAVTAEEDRVLEAITITARASTAQEAAAIANAVGVAYQEVVRADIQQQAQTAIAELNEARQEARDHLAELQDQLAADPDDETLMAEREVASQQLIAISNRVQQLAVDAALFGSGVEIFERADPPAVPVRPRPLRTGAVAALLAAFAAGALAWWRAEYSQVADTSGEVVQVLQAPPLGEIPVFRTPGPGSPERPLLDELDALSAESFHFLVASLQIALSDVGGRSVAVTSVTPGDGKTVVAMNLAFAASQDGSRVALLDADVRLRHLSDRLGVGDRPGLAEVVLQGLAVVDVAYTLRRRSSDAGPPVTIVPSGASIHEVAGFFRRPRFRQTIEEVNEESDLLIIDTPPVLAVSDILPIASHADGVLVVVTQGTPLQRLRQAKERLDLVGTPILGFVLNRAKTGERGWPYSRYHDEAVVDGDPSRPPQLRDVPHG